MIARDLEKTLQRLAKKYPIITLTGARQCGKSTLLRHCFADYTYVLLEEPDMREFAQEDPRGFLQNFTHPVIIDEAQYVPHLFSYIQSIVDAKNETGMFVLSGSQNFLLMESISQSLAGRTAVLYLSTFSISELSTSNQLPSSLNDLIFTGGYPRIYDKDIAPIDFFPSYIQTYIERDVRLLKNISDTSAFIRFIKLCAGCIGQVLNTTSLANEAGISAQTVQSWLSILETSKIIFMLNPYYKNFNKRITKSSKLYFYDTGLACSLLDLRSVKDIELHYMRGSLFENLIISEYFKQCFASGAQAAAWFWRDNNKNEIDLLIEKSDKLFPIEIKSGATMHSKYADTIVWFNKLRETSKNTGAIIYGGDQSYKRSDLDFISWKDTYTIFN